VGNVEVRLTLSFVLLFLAFCVFFHHNKSYHSSAACQNHSLTLLPYKTSIQQTNQQIVTNPELVDVKLSELTTVTNVFQVRDNPSSNGFIVTTTTTTPKLTVPPIHHSIQTKTTTDHQQREPRRHLPTCADDIEFFFSGTQRVTTTSHRRRPPHTHLLFVLLLRCLLSTSFIFSHTADTFIVTTTPNSRTTLRPFSL